MISLALAVAISSAAPDGAGRALERVEQSLRAEGRLLKGRFTVVAPELELRVTLDGVQLSAPMGLASRYVIEGEEQARAEGELVLLADELAVIAREAERLGLSVVLTAALWPRAQPPLHRARVAGSGSRESLSERCGALIAALRALRRKKGLQAVASHPEIPADEHFWDKTTGADGRLQEGVWRAERPGGGFVAARALTDGRAAVCGRLVLEERPAALAAKRLLEAGFEVYGDPEGPRFWKVGAAQELAAALKPALAAKGEKEEAAGGPAAP